jgi:hypothetical protein
LERWWQGAGPDLPTNTHSDELNVCNKKIYRKYIEWIKTPMDKDPNSSCSNLNRPEKGMQTKN